MADTTEDKSVENEEMAESMDSNDAEEEIYEVEKIVGMGQTATGSPLYKVRWLNYGPAWDTWEPPENLATCKDIIEEYLHKQKQQKEKEEQKDGKKSQPKEPKSQKKKKPSKPVDKDIYTAESSECDAQKEPKSSQGKPSQEEKKKDDKKKTWYYVSSSDEEADTLKDKFWRELEEGKIDVFSNDLYSKIKGTGRSSRPQSFKEMYKDKPLAVVDVLREESEPKRRKSLDDKGKGKRKRGQSARKTTGKSSPVAADDSSSTCSELDTGSQKTKKRRQTLKKQDSKDSLTKSTKPKSRTSRSKGSKSGRKTSEIPSEIPSSPETKDTMKDAVKKESEKDEESMDVAMEMVDCDGSEVVREELDMMQDDATKEEEDKQHEVQSARKRLGNILGKETPPSLQPVVALERVDKDAPKTEELSPQTTIENSEYSNDSHGSDAATIERTESIDSTEEKVSEAAPELHTEAKNTSSQKSRRPTVVMPNLEENEEDSTDNSNPEFNSPPVLVPQDAPPCSSTSKGTEVDSLIVSSQCTIPQIDSDTGCAVVVTASSLDTGSQHRGSNVASVASNSTISSPMHEGTASTPASSVPHSSPVPPPPAPPSFVQQPPPTIPQYVSHQQQNTTTPAASSMDNTYTGSAPLTSSTALPQSTALPHSTALSQSTASPHNTASQGTAGVLSSMQNTGKVTGMTTTSLGNGASAHNVRKNNYSLNDNTPQRRSSQDYYNGAHHNNQGEENFAIDLHEAGSPTVEKLRNSGVKVDDPRELNLMELRLAVKNNEFNKVHEALSQKKYDLEQLDRHGYRLVMIAAQCGYDDMLELLVKNGGASVNSQTENGTTPLMIACHIGLRCTVELLISLGANINHSNDAGETALIKAIKYRHKTIVDALLLAGCNVTSPNGDEENSPLTHALSLPSLDIYHTIKDYQERLSVELEKQAGQMLPNTAKLLHTLFPMQVYTLRENIRFSFTFSHELQPTDKGMGMLLFIGNALIGPSVVRCRLYGPCAVTSVLLNGNRLTPLTEEGYFISSFAPLLNGMNKVEIFTYHAPESKAKLLVSAYRAKLMM